MMNAQTMMITSLDVQLAFAGARNSNVNGENHSDTISRYITFKVLEYNMSESSKKPKSIILMTILVIGFCFSIFQLIDLFMFNESVARIMIWLAPFALICVVLCRILKLIRDKETKTKSKTYIAIKEFRLGIILFIFLSTTMIVYETTDIYSYYREKYNNSSTLKDIRIFSKITSPYKTDSREGNEKDILNHAILAYDAKDYEKAAQNYASIPNNAIALNNIGYMYSQGLYFDTNKDKALEYYEKAISLGCSIAAHNKLSLLFFEFYRNEFKNPDSDFLVEIEKNSDNDATNVFIEQMLPAFSNRITVKDFWDMSRQNKREFLIGALNYDFKTVPRRYTSVKSNSENIRYESTGSGFGYNQDGQINYYYYYMAHPKALIENSSLSLLKEAFIIESECK